MLASAVAQLHDNGVWWYPDSTYGEFVSNSFYTVLGLAITCAGWVLVLASLPIRMVAPFDCLYCDKNIGCLAHCV